MFLGIDIGSSSSKAVIINEQKKILGQAVINTGAGTQGPGKVVLAALQEAGISRAQVKASVVIGYGRIAYDKADKQITEISCHAKGAAHFMPNGNGPGYYHDRRCGIEQKRCCRSRTGNRGGKLP